MCILLLPKCKQETCQPHLRMDLTSNHWFEPEIQICIGFSILEKNCNIILTMIWIWIQDQMQILLPNDAAEEVNSNFHQRQVTLQSIGFKTFSNRLYRHSALTRKCISLNLLPTTLMQYSLTMGGTFRAPASLCWIQSSLALCSEFLNMDKLFNSSESRHPDGLHYCFQRKQISEQHCPHHTFNSDD